MDDTRKIEDVREQHQPRPRPPERDSSGGYEIKPPGTGSRFASELRTSAHRGVVGASVIVLPSERPEEP